MMLLSGCLSAAESVNLVPWPVLLDKARTDPARVDSVTTLVVQVRNITAKPLAKRAYRLENVQSPDGRATLLKDPVMREIFALAMSDTTAAWRMATELPLLAAAYRLTGDQAFKTRLVEQLDEVSTWSPIQRGGWTCYHNGATYPKDWTTNPWWDGSWLATGSGIGAIADTFEIVPAGMLDAALVDKLHKLLEGEIAQITDDWKNRRQWFVKAKNPITNQWVMPTAGLIRACLVLGKDRHKDAYELGVANMLASLDAQNGDGSYAEGWFYAKSWTVPAMLATGRAMALQGDSRVLDHPFIRKFPRWFAHQFQPGRQWVQSFDSIYAVRDSYGQMAGLLSQIAVCTGDHDARWLLAHIVAERPTDHWGMAALALPVPPREDEPPLFARYDGARAVMWRSSWAEDADGVWLRGGHPNDQHDHRDRGHVSFTSKGRPILIECGTPYYGHEAIASHFQSGAGHNVLQLGDGPMPTNATFGPDFKRPQGWQEDRIVAPVNVIRLDAKGGEVTVIVTSGYSGLTKWERRVTWSNVGLTVADTVALKQPQIVLFRWHLGTAEEAQLDGTTATWTDATLAVASDTSLSARQERRQDHTLEAKNDHHEHACIVVRTKDPVKSVTITTTVELVRGRVRTEEKGTP